jgi:hypothetical protein
MFDVPAIIDRLDHPGSCRKRNSVGEEDDHGQLSGQILVAS